MAIKDEVVVSHETETQVVESCLQGPSGPPGAKGDKGDPGAG